MRNTLLLCLLPFVSLAQPKTASNETSPGIKGFVEGNYITQSYTTSSQAEKLTAKGFNFGVGVRTVGETTLLGGQFSLSYNHVSLSDISQYFGGVGNEYIKASLGLVGDDSIGAKLYFHYGTNINLWIPMGGFGIKPYASAGLNAGIGFSKIQLKLQYELGLSEPIKTLAINGYPADALPKYRVNTLSLGLIVYPSGI